MHTLLDLHGNIPTFIRITDGKTHDVNILDEIGPEPGAFYVMDRAYVDFERLFVFTLCSSFFVVRTRRTSCSNGATRIPSTGPRACARIRPSSWAPSNRPKRIRTRCGGSATSTPRRTSGCSS